MNDLSGPCDVNTDGLYVVTFFNKRYAKENGCKNAGNFCHLRNAF